MFVHRHTSETNRKIGGIDMSHTGNQSFGKEYL